VTCTTVPNNLGCFSEWTRMGCRPKPTF